MRIALLTDGIYPHIMGGMQKHSYYLAKYLARAGVKVDVYHAIPEGQPLPTTPEGFTEEELQNLKFFPVHFPKPAKYPGHYIRESYIYSKKVYREFILQPQPDFVYIQGFSGWAYLKRKDTKAQRKKNIVFSGINFHGVEMFQQAPSLKVKLEHLLLRPWVKWNLRLSDIIFSLGGKLTHIQKQLSSAQNRIIEMPIGITKDWLIDEAPEQKSKIRKFAFIGRYERRKGIEELHSVLQQLIKEKQPFEFHFIGPIPEAKRLKSPTPPPWPHEGGKQPPHQTPSNQPIDLLTYRPNNLVPYSPSNLNSYLPNPLTSPSLTPWPPEGGNQPATKTSNRLLAYSPTNLIYHGAIRNEKKYSKSSVMPTYSSAPPGVKACPQ